MVKRKRLTNSDVAASALVALATALPAYATSVAVPEPSSIALFGAGLASAILVARIWRKK